MVLVAGACIESTLPTADEFVTGAVEGHIVDASGAAVPNPTVAITLITQPVSGTSRQLGQVNFIAGELGRFIILFQVGDEPEQTALAAVTVTPPPGRGLASADTVGIPVRLWRGTVPQDSAFVVVTLPAR
jgi:hypothetical protein